MNLKVTNLDAGDREVVTRAKQRLENLLPLLDALSHDVDEIVVVAQKAEAERATLSGKVARDPDAAVRIIGLDAQLQALRPQIAGRQRLLVDVFGQLERAIYLVNRSIIRERFGIRLAESIRDEIETRLAPFYPTPHDARRQADGTHSMMILYGYTHRERPDINDIETAKSAAAETITELENILAGKPIVNVESWGARLLAEAKVSHSKKVAA